MSETAPTSEKAIRPVIFTKFAAFFSVVAPFLSAGSYLLLFWLVMFHAGVNATVASVISWAALLINILGLIFGVLAWIRTSWRDSKGLLMLGAAGIGLNALFLTTLLILPRFLMPSHPTTAQDRLQVAMKKLDQATNEAERFYALDRAAKESFNAGKINDAEAFAKELLKSAPHFAGDWNYGNAIQDGNLVLGRIAARNGNIQEAGKYLLLAGGSPGSPTMDSFGPNMSLAKDLLERGQREVVLQYFELCRKFWTADFGKLDEWTTEVKAGKVPSFGANLVY